MEARSNLCIFLFSAVWTSVHTAKQNTPEGSWEAILRKKLLQGRSNLSQVDACHTFSIGAFMLAEPKLKLGNLCIQSSLFSNLCRGGGWNLADVRRHWSVRARHRSDAAGPTVASGGGYTGRREAAARHDQPALHPRTPRGLIWSIIFTIKHSLLQPGLVLFRLKTRTHCFVGSGEDPAAPPGLLVSARAGSVWFRQRPHGHAQRVRPGRLQTRRRLPQREVCKLASLTTPPPPEKAILKRGGSYPWMRWCTPQPTHDCARENATAKSIFCEGICVGVNQMTVLSEAASLWFGGVWGVIVCLGFEWQSERERDRGLRGEFLIDVLQISSDFRKTLDAPTRVVDGGARRCQRMCSVMTAGVCHTANVLKLCFLVMCRNFALL